MILLMMIVKIGLALGILWHEAHHCVDRRPVEKWHDRFTPSGTWVGEEGC